MMPAMGRILIAGAGIFGVTAALELRRRGHDVTLLDPGPLPRPEAASTDVSKIVRLDYGADDAATALMERALEGWRAWNRQALGRGLPALFHEDGLLVLTTGAMEPGGFEHDSHEVLVRRGHRPERLDAAALAARHPAWNAARWTAGYRNPEGGWAESGAVVARLIGEARAAGVAVLEGRRVVRLVEERGRIAGLASAPRDSGAPGASGTPVGSGTPRASAEPVGGRQRELVATEHRADHVVVAAGAWTPLLLPWLAGSLAVTGQPVLLFRPAQPDAFRPPRFPPFTADVSRTGFYGFPALPDGTVKIGHHGAGTAVHPDDPRDVPAGTEATFRAFLAATLPTLADAPLAGSRLCLYSDSPDGHFWIDHDPERPGLLVAAGDSGHAFKFAPVLGALVADALERRDDAATRAMLGRCRWRAAASAPRGASPQGAAPPRPGDLCSGDRARAGRTPVPEPRS